MQYLVMTNDRTEVDWTLQRFLLEKEAKAVCGLLCSGKLRNIWFTEKDQNAVLLFEEHNEEAVRKLMDSLPLVNERLIEYQIIGLTAYDGLERLLPAS